jgi:hypothetical protein
LRREERATQGTAGDEAGMPMPRTEGAMFVLVCENSLLPKFMERLVCRGANRETQKGFTSIAPCCLRAGPSD